jgi:hypothetical protein
VTFRHQRHLELLAASYLVDRGASREQVNILVDVRSPGVLPTPMIGVVAWLIELRPELVGDLIEHNASRLASAAALAELPHGPGRAALVGALLDSAARGDEEPAWGIDPHTLVHDELGDRLGAQLEKGLATSVELWWLARQAAAGGCTHVVPELVAAAHDTAWTEYARHAAVEAVRHLPRLLDPARPTPPELAKATERPRRAHDATARTSTRRTDQAWHTDRARHPGHQPHITRSQHPPTSARAQTQLDIEHLVE